MPWDPARTRRDSRESDVDIEIAARAKLKAEQYEKEKQLAAEAKKATEAQENGDAPLSGGLFRMVTDDFEAPVPPSPEVPRKAKEEGEGAAGSVAYPVNASPLPLQRTGIHGNVTTGRERTVSAEQIIERGKKASKEFFGTKTEAESAQTHGDSKAMGAETEGTAASLPPAPTMNDTSSASQLMMHELFEQLRAERQRADRLEQKVNELTEQLVDAHDKIAGTLERENQRWAEVHQSSGALKRI
jgi:hypothetical protein